MAVTVTAAAGAQGAPPTRSRASTTLASLVDELMEVTVRVAMLLVVRRAFVRITQVMLVVGIVAVEHVVLVVPMVFVLVVVHVLTSVRLGFKLTITIYR